MERETSALLRLPQELRDEIYRYVLLEAEEIRLALPNTLHHLKGFTTQPRHQARLLRMAPPDGSTVLSIPASVCRVNRQLQAEASNFLEDSKLPIVTRVHNFDFDHVMRYLDDERKLQRHAVGKDGTAPRRLVIELTGPHTTRWRENLTRFIEWLDQALPEAEAEFGALHRTVRCAPYNGRLYVRAPTKIVSEVHKMHRSWPRGAGQLQLEKMFFTMFVGGESEQFYEQMEGSDWEWYQWSHIHRGIRY